MEKGRFKGMFAVGLQERPVGDADIRKMLSHRSIESTKRIYLRLDGRWP